MKKVPDFLLSTASVDKMPTDFMMVQGYGLWKVDEVFHNMNIDLKYSIKVYT